MAATAADAKGVNKSLAMGEAATDEILNAFDGRLILYRGFQKLSLAPLSRGIQFSLVSACFLRSINLHHRHLL